MNLFKVVNFTLIFLLQNFYAISQELRSQTFYYLVDESSQLTREDVMMLNSKMFKHTNSGVINMSFSEFPVWVNIPIENRSHSEVICIENGHLDIIHFYLFRDGILVDSSLQGKNVAFGNRELNYRYPNLKIPNGVDQVILKVHGKSPVLIPIALTSEADFYENYLTGQLGYFLYLGILTLGIIIYLYIYRSLRLKRYLFYALSIFSIGIASFADNGYLYQVLWPEHPEYNHFIPSIIALLVFVVVFASYFFEVKKTNTVLYRIFIGIYFLHGLVIFLNFIGLATAPLVIIYIVWTLMPFFLISVSWYYYRCKKMEEAKYLLFAWFFLLVSLLFYGLSIATIIPYNRVIGNLPVLGASLEVVFMFLALAKKFQVINIERNTLFEKQKEKLEELLDVRTRELLLKNERLKCQNKELLNLKEHSERQMNEMLKQKSIIEDQNLKLQGKKHSLEELVDQKTEHLKQAYKDLEDRNNRFEQFTFIAAHNLRGPVVTLKGILNIHKTNLEEGKKPQLLKEAEITIDKLDSIIKELIFILDLPLNTSFLKETTDINEIINKILCECKSELDALNACMQFECRSLPLVKSVPVYLESVLRSIMSNAIRFRNELGSLELLLRCSHYDSGVTFSLSDNGQGIDLEKYKDKLFKPFQRFHLNSGKGLGLFIVKSQLDAIGGKIKLEGNSKGGLTVIVEIPYK